MSISRGPKIAFRGVNLGSRGRGGFEHGENERARGGRRWIRREKRRCAVQNDGRAVENDHRAVERCRDATKLRRFAMVKSGSAGPKKGMGQATG